MVLVRIFILICLILAFSGPALAGPGEADPDRQLYPPANPYLADVYNNQGHWNDAATDATDVAVARGHYRLTPGSYQIVPNDALGIPAYTAEVGGQRIHWFFAGTSMRKLVWQDGVFTEISRVDLPVGFTDYRRVDAEERLSQATRIEGFLKAGDERGLADYLGGTPNRLLSAVEDQVSSGVLYSLFTRDHALIGSNARGLIRIGNTDPSDPFSMLSEPFIYRLPDALFDNERVARLTIFPADTVFGLSMSFNGYLVINTIGGKIVTLDRDTFEVRDVYQVKGDDEVFTNSFATSEECGGGAVYVASNRMMYRLVIDPEGRIQDTPASGAWQADYPHGRRLAYGKISDGTGATPTLMGFGPDEDRLVVLTDGADQMGLVAFWRDTIPGDAEPPAPGLPRRLADSITVDLGKGRLVQSEQSVVVHDGYAFVVNGVPAEGVAPYPARGSYLRGLLTGTSRPAPAGAAMYRWDAARNRWEPRWKRTDIAVLATVPFISGPSHMVVVNGYFQGRWLDLFHLGLDLDSGEVVMSIASGGNPLFNGTFTGVKCDHDGALMYTTMFGLVRFDVSLMEGAENPDRVSGEGRPGLPAPEKG